jgi:hypothetical protein
MRTLSSDWTFFFKFIFPLIWIGGFAGITLAMFIFPDSFHSAGAGSLQDDRLKSLLGTILGGSAIYWSCMRLKKVSLKDDILRISNFRREIEVPLRDIERVSGSILIHPELVWLHFRAPTGFGTKVIFMGKVRSGFGLTPHPVVEEIERLIGTAKYP